MNPPLLRSSGEVRALGFIRCLAALENGVGPVAAIRVVTHATCRESRTFSLKAGRRGFVQVNLTETAAASSAATVARTRCDAAMTGAVKWLMFIVTPDLASSLAFEVTPFGDMYKLRPGALGSLKEHFSSKRSMSAAHPQTRFLIVPPRAAPGVDVWLGN